MYMRLAKTLFVVLFPFTMAVQAQHFDEKNFTLFSTRDGLTDVRVTSISQDEFGYVWVGTYKGLNRFDGLSFLQFYSDSNRNSLPNDYIRQLKKLDIDQLGASSPTGLHIVNPRTLEQRNIIVPTGPLQQQYRENSVQAMARDEWGSIFLLTATGFYHLNDKEELIFRYDHIKNNDPNNATVSFGRIDGIIQPERGVFLLATTDGPYIYYSAKKDLHPVGAKDDPFYQQIAPPGGRIHFMHGNSNSFSVIQEGAKEMALFDLKQKRKYLIETTLTGLDKLFDWRSKLTLLDDSTFIINSSQKGFYLLRRNASSGRFVILPEIYLANFQCVTVLLDKQQRLWVGTDRGLLQQKKNKGNVQRFKLSEDPNIVSSHLNARMITMSRDKIFVATSGKGVYVFDRSSMRLLQQIDLSQYGLTGNTIINVMALNDDSVYAATYGPLVGINAANYTHRMIPLPNWDRDHDWISWQLLGSDKTWYLTANKRNQFYYRSAHDKNISIASYTNDSLFDILPPMYINEDASGNIWFGGHGASRFDTHNRQFNLLMDSFPKIKTARKEINGLGFDKRGKIYFGLEENGMAIYDPSEKHFDHITRTNGLPDNTIRALYLHNDKVWLGTERGLASYDIATKKINSFGIADDMPEGNVTSYSFYYDSVHRQLYAGFNNTVVRFDPDSLAKNNSPPEFFIESIQIPGLKTIYHPEGQLDLLYKHNNIVVSLAAVNFEDAYQQRFAYRLVTSGEEAWQEIGSQRNIIFSNLSPGNYRLELKAFINNNSWPAQVAAIKIIVDPPFWRKAWFIALCALLLIAIVTILVRLRIKNIRQHANMNIQLAELEMKGLHAQMNPHFIFNSLNSIKEMILEDEKQNASRYLSKFAQLIRTSLDHSKQTFISVQQCIHHLQQYLEMEKIRFEDFVYTIHIDPELSAEHILMPPMLIQPLVENAIWHGLHPQKGNKQLEIKFFSKGSILTCEIEDNGIGIKRSMQNNSDSRPSHRSFGIANVRERLKVLNEKYNMNCSLNIIDKESLPRNNGSGTTVRLELTIINQYA